MLSVGGQRFGPQGGGRHQRGYCFDGAGPVSYTHLDVYKRQVYQYGLLRLMVDIVFKDVEGVPTYKFDFPTMLISLACFITIYEIMMYIYSEKIKKISIKEIMIE